MGIKEAIEKYIAKGTKSAIVLELLIDRKSVTCDDIILYNYEINKKVFTTSPHKIIETLRKNFGADFVKDVDIEFMRIYHTNGIRRTAKDTYKRYFLNPELV